LPVVGIGSAIIFDFENDPVKYAERRRARCGNTTPSGR
jgi:hypothetical protein